MFRPYEEAVLQLVEFIGQSNRNLGLFLLMIVAIPVALMLIR
jgi:hypothetical protein